MTLCQDLMMDTHCWGLTCYAARSGSGFANKMLWLLIDSLYVKIWQVSPKHWTWDMIRLSTWLVLGSCARAILHESHACRSWSFAVERRFGAAWMKGLCGTNSWPVPAQFCYSCDMHEKTRKQWRFFLCAIWTFVGKVWRWWDCSLWWLDCCDSGRKFSGHDCCSRSLWTLPRPSTVICKSMWTS